MTAKTGTNEEGSAAGRTRGGRNQTAPPPGTPRLADLRLPNGQLLTHRPWRDRAILRESSRHMPKFLEQSLAPTDRVLDIGAHIGIITLWAAPLCEAVFAFEPEPENYDLLLQNTNCLPNASAFRMFVGADGGPEERKLFLARGDYSSHSAFVKRGRASITVKTIGISLALATSRATFVKMDCEGAEYEIILGGLLKQEPLPRVITYEAHHNRSEYRKAHEECLAALRAAGYEILRERPRITGWPQWVHAERH